MLKDDAVYEYHGKSGVYKGMQIHKGIATIILEGSDTQEVIKKDFAKIDEWLPEFKLVSLPEKHLLPSLPVPVKSENSLIAELKDKLLSDIDRVRTDKEYIPQAKQACNTTNTLLNLVKLEIRMKGGVV